MALTKCTVPTDVIGSLGTSVADRGLTTQQFKDKFDEMPEGIKTYLNDTLTVEVDAHVAENMNAHVPEAVKAPELLNSWVNYGNGYEYAGYYKDSFGVVHLTGLIVGGTPDIYTQLFILPEGYRPASICALTTSSNDLGTPKVTFIEVHPDGRVQIGGVAAGSTYLLLGGLSFRT